MAATEPTPGESPVGAVAQPVIGIVIDDMGNRRGEGLRAIELPGPVTYAFLPHTPYAGRLARLAHHLEKEVMLHLPMESAHGERLGPGGIVGAMDRRELDRVVTADIQAVPHVRGINNHMGSLLTRHQESMEWLMEILRERRDLYFVDSRTTASSVAATTARRFGIPTASRDVFLDHDPHPQAIRRQFRELVAVAREKGHALGIGHPYPDTLEVLAQELRALERHGVRLVPVSALTGAGGAPADRLAAKTH